MLSTFDHPVNKHGMRTNPEPAARSRPAPAAGAARAARTAKAPARRRLTNGERERQIVDGAVRFFADRGLDGQLRDLANDIGVTHTLVYHYFPTKQALIDRVYAEIFEGLWDPAWEALLDDPALDVETKIASFYVAYAKGIFSREFVRIIVFSGLADGTIPSRFFELLRARLFPRLVRETRRHIGTTRRARPTARELEYLMGLHGGIFYIGLRRWVYAQPVHGGAGLDDETAIRDRVRGYLHAARDVLVDDASGAKTPRTARRRT